MFLAVVVSLLCSVYYYVESFKSALPAKRWAMAGLVFGPLVFPVFTISQHVALRHAQGFQNTTIRA
ncbi:hypothetical protein OAP14_02375 [Aliiglaciecola sp.]|nr:hypothetical protein [Aliiglaciecola sp.]